MIAKNSKLALLARRQSGSLAHGSAMLRATPGVLAEALQETFARPAKARKLRSVKSQLRLRPL
jgi:hypothetical protein